MLLIGLRERIGILQVRIRPYIASKDFEIISQWITDERTHAMWCANLIEYPIKKQNFDSVLEYAANKFCDSPYVATTDDGVAIGFFCYSSNLDTNEGFLKFVMIDDKCRGKGYGRDMLSLAVKYAFEIAKVDAVQLNVFPENAKAKACYASVGFVERRVDENVFKFQDESWSRCNMVIKKTDLQ